MCVCVCVCVCVCSVSVGWSNWDLKISFNSCCCILVRSFVKSRHLWKWSIPIFAELCEKSSEEENEALEEGLEITRDFMRTYVKSSLHPT